MNNIKPNNKLENVFAWNVETLGSQHDDSGFNKKTRIMSINVVGENVKDVITYPSERKIIKAFKKKYVQPHITLVGFNSVSFDEDRFSYRANLYNIDVSDLPTINIDIRKFIPERKIGDSTLRNLGLDIGHKFSVTGYGKNHTFLIWKHDQIMDILKEKLLDNPTVVWKVLVDGMPSYALKKYLPPVFPIENKGVINYILQSNAEATV